jgi:hypothetical protein
VPLAVDITASLVEAALQDRQLCGSDACQLQASDHTLRLIYALPIIRFVLVALLHFNRITCHALESYSRCLFADS